MKVRIIPATMRDLSYVAANMRPEDRTECDAQLGWLDHISLAAIHLRDWAFIAEVNGNPECAFGAARVIGDHLLTAWSFGTKNVKAAVPAVTRHVRRVMIPEIYETPAMRVEARAMASNTMALRWLSLMGAERRCDLPSYGRQGEGFVLFDWTRERYSQCERLNSASTSLAA